LEQELGTLRGSVLYMYGGRFAMLYQLVRYVSPLTLLQGFLRWYLVQWH